jgi:hypothetical protein
VRRCGVVRGRLLVETSRVFAGCKFHSRGIDTARITCAVPAGRRDDGRH